MDPLLDEALERLWGIESRLNTGYRPWGHVERPSGFHVVEPRPKLPPGEGWSWYLVMRVGMDSWRTLRT
ncbi:MAG: hypothetical protein F7B18_06160, partial [Desulfurococcales archaeon]|nr:hypothetical protein [Desulfurococcales archaeon]